MFCKVGVKSGKVGVEFVFDGVESRACGKDGDVVSVLDEVGVCGLRSGNVMEVEVEECGRDD